jgi:hypothetical protein
MILKMKSKAYKETRAYIKEENSSSLPCLVDFIIVECTIRCPDR